MAKHHDLRQTKTMFQLTGLLNGVDKDKFYVEGETSKTKRKTNRTRFGIKTTPKCTIFGVGLDGFVMDSVKYAVAGDFKDQREVSWNDRYSTKVLSATFGDNSYVLNNAKTVALDKTVTDDKGKIQKKRLTNYDANAELNTLVSTGKINDETKVFVRGVIKPYTYSNGNKGVNLEPSYIGLSSNTTPLEELTEQEVYENSLFEMEIVVKEVAKYDDKWTASAYIVGYDFIEEMDFGFTSDAMAEAFATLKPYTMIKCQGMISYVMDSEPVEVETKKVNMFSSGKFKTVDVENRVGNGGYKMVYLIDSADADTIDTESYSEESVMDAIKALKAFADDNKRGEEKVVETSNNVSFESTAHKKVAVEVDDDEFDVDMDLDF